MTRTRKRTRTIVRYSVLGAVILALALYLAFRGSDRISYTIPDLPAVAEGDIDTILIHSEKNGTIDLKRQNGGWLILPTEYEVDSRLIRAMIDSIVDFELTEVVSEASFYERFDLDPDTRYEVTAQNQGTTLLRFDVGKQAPTYNHIYVTLPLDTRVFQATGILVSAFDKEIEALRDKLVLSLNPDNVLRIDVTTESESFRLIKSEEEDAVRWTGSDSAIWDTEVVGAALDRMRNLRAIAFVEDTQLDLDRPVISLEMQEEETYQLLLFGATESAYLARSSQTPYTFTISTFQAEQIMEAFSSGP